jgi:hypothetical protein
MIKYLSIFVFLFTSITNTQTHKGEINGRVIDSRTQEPIPSVNVVIIEKPEIGTSTDTNGIFKFRGLNVGTYSLKISAVGYTPQVITNIVVTTGRATPITIKLIEKAVEIEGVTTTVTYFDRAQEMSSVSANVIARSEVLRSPGGLQDLQSDGTVETIYQYSFFPVFGVEIEF